MDAEWAKISPTLLCATYSVFVGGKSLKTEYLHARVVMPHAELQPFGHRTFGSTMQDSAPTVEISALHDKCTRIPSMKACSHRCRSRCLGSTGIAISDSAKLMPTACGGLGSATSPNFSHYYGVLCNDHVFTLPRP